MPVLPWYLAFKVLGQDDKNSIKIGCSVLLAVTACSQKKSIVDPSNIILSEDHNWDYDKIIPSGTGKFNIGKN
eukprot:4543546-Ditylum_brightwellii.AAC.1